MVDIVAGIAVSVACEVGKCLLPPVGQHCGYVIFSDRHVRKLDDEVKKLDSKRGEVQSSINVVRRNVKPIKPEVDEWMEKADAGITNAREIRENDEIANTTCFYGWLPNPKARYRLGKEASGKVKVIEELIRQGQFERVYDENPPPGLVGGAPDGNSSAGDGDGGDFITDSRAPVFQDIIKALNDEKLKVVGVYGPGGVGKTTLLDIVEKKLKNGGGPFKYIARATVSRTPDFTKIQYDIAHALSLDSLKNEPSEEGRRHLLFKRLEKDPDKKKDPDDPDEKDPNEKDPDEKKGPNEKGPDEKKVLIILDDLWEELDLEKVGIPSGDTGGKCKLLLTSRNKGVLELHEAQIFRLDGLKEDEALRLFEKTVGNRLQDDEGLKAKAAQVVRKLAGLPLLIKSIAKILKCREVFEWNSMLIKIEDPKAERIVKWSYDYLMGEDVKCLFLLCGLIGGTIEVELLLGLSMGLGLFESETITKSRDRLSTMLHRLHSFCLLQGGGDGKENVTIHDLYSEVVVSGAFSDQISLMFYNMDGSWPKEKLERCWACLVNVGRNSLAELMLSRFPNVKILMLAEKSDGGDCKRMDFTYMEELRVLYLCSMHITSFPSSMEILRNLQSLSINCDVEDVTNLGKLKALQILSFARSKISRLPKEIGELTNLRSLNLSYCYSLKIIELGALKGLINLEELHMRESFDRWMGKDEIPSELCNARLVELNSLKKIASLEISIPDPTILLEDDDFPFGNLIRFRINIGNARGRTIGDLRTMELKLEEWDSILSKDWVQKLLQKTQYLHLDGLKEFKKNTHELCTQGFGELKHLDIANSPSINYIANSSDGLPLTAFTMLESLRLDNLNNLEKICNSLVAPECFSILKVVTIAKCPQLKNLWFLSEMQRLVHLERLIVSYCDSMQAIITNGAGNIGVAVDDTVELPNLRILDLFGLPKMTSFCTGAEGAPIQVSLPRLESLRTNGLLGLEEILYSDPSMKYNNLKSLEIINSKSRSKCILKSGWILKLSNLESMRIDSFPSAEVFFDMEELKLTGDAEILPQPTLKLYGLRNLQCMWKQDVQLQGISIFRNLGELYVYDTKLSFLFPVSVAKCLRAIRNIEVGACPFMKAVIVDEEGSNEGTYDVIEFPLLKQLCISGCPAEKFFSYPHGNKKSVTTNSDSQDTNSNSFFDQKVSLPHLETLDFQIEEPTKSILQKIWHGELPGSSFCELATLRIGYCSKLLNIFPSTITKRLHNLKSVHIYDCSSLKSLFDCGSPDENTEQTTVLLPKLETVMVNRARKLRCMVESDSQMILCFPSLKEVHVNDCSDMRYLFPNFTATTLTQLKKICISHCEQMKEVVLEKGGGQSEADVMNFRSLVDLRICNCPNLGAFIRSPMRIERQLGEMVEENNESPKSLFNEMVTFPNIGYLLISGLQCKELWNNQIPANSFRKLESLELRDCNNLQRVAPSHMWKRLQCCLEDLHVISCRSIEIIYEGDETDIEGGKLGWLVLHNLENLRCIWQSDGLPNIPFPNLRDVEVVRCSRLKMLFTTFTAKFLGQIKELVVESCEDMELIAGHEKGEEGSGTAITFSKLTFLRLFELPKCRNFLPDKYSLKFRCPKDFPSLQVWNIESCREEPHQVHGDWKQHLRKREERMPRGNKEHPWWRYV